MSHFYLRFFSQTSSDEKRQNKKSQFEAQIEIAIFAEPLRLIEQTKHWVACVPNPGLIIFIKTNSNFL